MRRRSSQGSRHEYRTLDRDRLQVDARWPPGRQHAATISSRPSASMRTVLCALSETDVHPSDSRCRSQPSFASAARVVKGMDRHRIETAWQRMMSENSEGNRMSSTFRTNASSEVDATQLLTLAHMLDPADHGRVWAELGQTYAGMPHVDFLKALELHSFDEIADWPSDAGTVSLFGRKSDSVVVVSATANGRLIAGSLHWMSENRPRLQSRDIFGLEFVLDEIDRQHPFAHWWGLDEGRQVRSPEPPWLCPVCEFHFLAQRGENFERVGVRAEISIARLSGLPSDWAFRLDIARTRTRLDSQALGSPA